jgi:hypothetical protein
MHTTNFPVTFVLTWLGPHNVEKSRRHVAGCTECGRLYAFVEPVGTTNPSIRGHLDFIGINTRTVGLPTTLSPHDHFSSELPGAGSSEPDVRYERRA